MLYADSHCRRCLFLNVTMIEGWKAQGKILMRECAAANDSNLSITQIKVHIYRMKSKN